MNSRNRIPSLDGLRAFSIILVLLDHAAGSAGFPISSELAHRFEIGFFGVRVFFVISGFLITGILLRELKRSGRISLGNFYLRRTLRIFPPYYVLLLITWLLSLRETVTLNPGDMAHAVTYTSNYYLNRSWFLNHTWSLSVEEQFYILWPGLLLFLGARGACVGAFVFVCAAPFIRLAYYLHGMQVPIGDTFETAADAIAVGCLLAAAREWLWQKGAYQRFLSSPLFVAIPVATIALTVLHGHPRLEYLLGQTLMNVGIALTLDWCVRFPEGRVGRVLNWTPIAFIGVMSYSLYLWQQLFLSQIGNPYERAPLNLVLALGAALISFYVIERPALRIREWLERRNRVEEFPLAAEVSVPLFAK